jgi:DNA-directed RNA polymerase specialized sigma24 family protein
MSPLPLRRYRAERLLREEFERLRARVLASVTRRLERAGLRLDEGDLEACYAQAWQGLYGVILEGGEIENPAGWLVVTTFRRAIDVHRSCGPPIERRAAAADAGSSAARWERDDGSGEDDLAAALDDRLRLSQLVEGLQSRLSPREREAAALCYLQGLSRSEAAARMGISDRRMRRLMEGRSPARPGVAAKVGTLVETIRQGAWCEQQGSLMRALAFGVLDPQGERYRLAARHHSRCPACRAYVLSLRGLASALPPSFWPFGAGAAILSHASAGGHAGSAAAAGKGAGAGAAGAGGTGGIAAGAGAAGGAGSGGALAGGAGSALVGGPLAAKLAVGCLLALGVGVGCVVAQDRTDRGHGGPGVARVLGPAGGSRQALPSPTTQPRPSPIGASVAIATAAEASPVRHLAESAVPARAAREFSPEGSAGAVTGVPARVSEPVATAASAQFSPEPSATAARTPTAAEREFSPG